ncbi:biotin--[acetyl-CoA-carboxylase] ligase [Moraxella haemolytica]|uniref:biotin--[acetyl-CoA-carboxylase] ligase n=1 Tax=Moraxella haemolytica TaxID=2904119 RepID=UPI0025429A15|nr:biotin--[acetyl-CoA-carboxylase] ligase [Moraxella sp. ZY171148]WII94909.1 biotin--[acetyl-CoA-carboxylase] ligase [Moraxella sp. ZY171148]
MPFLAPTCHRHFDEIGSTNTALIHAIESGHLAHTISHLYTADYQTAGRGQHGRTWVSGENNVFLSLYIPMGKGVFELNTLSGLLSVAVGFELAKLPIIQTVNEHRRTKQLPTLGVKWANDVGFYDDELGLFKKLAGILIEPVFKKIEKNTLTGVVIGIGLNVNNSPKIKDGLYQATCLQELFADLDIFAQELYIPIANAIFEAIKTCNHCKEPSHLQHFIDQFNQNHLLSDKLIHVFIQNNMGDIHAKGKCIGIGNQGELLLNDNGKIKQIFAGMAKIVN